MELFAKGKRSFIYLFTIDGKKIAMKVDNGRVKNTKKEVNWLQKLNKKKIGPKLLFYGKDFFCYDFVEGKPIKELKRKNKKVFVQVLKQCRVMDKMKVNKLEMHKPLKHVIINKGKVTMIDFERCYETDKPKNVSQFCSFLVKYFKYDKELLKLAKKYKDSYKEADFKKIINFL
ncbi:hypothetical protein HOD38_06000 [archaeon]|jgi:putative serine/threonine protein kinase|nr:hypothetical protein [archaeon]MBT4397791.1 hypothetical protein [archaeon]MBT4441125.1 hypothetical protein [archaeon]